MIKRISEDKLVLRTIVAFLENTSDWFFVKDLDLNYVCSSKSFAVFMGYKEATEIIGKTDTDLFGEKLAKLYNADDRKLIKSGKSMVDYVEPVPVINNRKRYSSTSKHLIRDENGEIIGLYGIGKDITLQVELENEAKTANAAKSDFFARISHDMRTPMNGILGLVNLALDESTNDSVSEKLKSISTTGQYLLELINDTLDLNKIDSQKAKPDYEAINGADFYKSVLACLSSKIIEKKIDITFSPSADEIGIIVVDKIKMQQIFVNLLSNAIKFTPEGGRVFIDFVNSENDDSSYFDKIIVRDNGIGISEDFLPRIFEPFEQEKETDDAQMGSGLGMAIVFKLVNLMDGKIEISSQKNIGTEITISIRINRPSSATIEKNSSLGIKSLMGLNILLCEDNKINQQIAVSLLKKVGCLVEVADNGEIGLEMFKASQEGHYFAVLMDIRMPVMNGLQATSEIRALKRPDASTVPIIAMSANTFEEDIQSSKKAGVNAHLAKPIDTKLLFKTLNDFSYKRS